jgi:L-amino acid N-acyltransferase YncA/DNA-binding transcriptional ArsR family regulator
MHAEAVLEQATAARYASWFRALADPTRLQVLALLAGAGRGMGVGDIAARVGRAASTVSQHLAVLAEAGFVLVDQDGTDPCYRIDEAGTDRLPAAAAALTAGSARDCTGEGGCPAPPPPGPPAAAGGVTVRPMRATDADQVLAIYQAGLDTGEASFETTAPTWERFDATRHPLHRHVAVDAAGRLAGWVTAAPVSDRCVYAGVVEHSVYVHPGDRGRGIGTALLGALIGSTESAGVWTIQSGIFPENAASVRLHRRAGFRGVGIRLRIGRHEPAGQRPGRWRDVLLMERRSRAVGVD